MGQMKVDECDLHEQFQRDFKIQDRLCRFMSEVNLGRGSLCYSIQNFGCEKIMGQSSRKDIVETFWSLGYFAVNFIVLLLDVC